MTHSLPVLPEVIQGSLFDLRIVIDYGQSIMKVAASIAESLQKNSALSTRMLQGLMNRYFLGTAAEGAWSWKDAYEAVEVAQILCLRQKQREIISDPPDVML